VVDACALNGSVVDGEVAETCVVKGEVAAADVGAVDADVAGWVVGPFCDSSGLGWIDTTAAASRTAHDRDRFIVVS
jgi:hypothetical protein